MLNLIIFVAALVSTMAYIWFLVLYCYKLQKYFPDEWSALGRPMMGMGNKGLRRLIFMIIQGRHQTIGDEKLVILGNYVRALLILSIVLIIPIFLFGIEAIFKAKMVQPS